LCTVPYVVSVEGIHLGIKGKLISLLVTASTFFPFNSAQAHGPVPPLPVHLARHVLLASFRIPGLSGASSAVVIRNRSITSNAINAGFNSVAIHQLQYQGQINSGLLVGAFYESFGGGPNPYTLFPKYVLAFGNNPLSVNGGVANGQMGPSSVVNSIVFAPASPTVNTVSIVHGMILNTKSPIIHESGALRAAENQIKELNENGFALGVKVGNQAFASSPIVAGEFFGTDYYQPVLGTFLYARNTPFVYAFGSNPLNTGTTTTNVNLNLSQLSNYIELANGKVFTYSSGLIPASGYFLKGYGYTDVLDNNWIFALGKNQYNFFNNFASAPRSITFTKLPTPYLSF
jgi:hypothetical protein